MATWTWRLQHRYSSASFYLSVLLSYWVAYTWWHMDTDSVTNWVCPHVIPFAAEISLAFLKVNCYVMTLIRSRLEEKLLSFEIQYILICMSQNCGISSLVPAVVWILTPMRCRKSEVHWNGFAAMAVLKTIPESISKLLWQEFNFRVITWVCTFELLDYV